MPTKIALDAPGCGNGALAGEAIQVCLISVHYNQHPDDREAEAQIDQAHSGRNLL
jgi:hypothetical protein